MIDRRFAVAALSLFLVGPTWAQTPATSAAQPGPDDRAKQWLSLLDDGNYTDGFQQMARAAQARTNAAAEAQRLRAVREPLGAMASRDLKDVNMTKAVPGLAAGQYAVVRYDSRFARKGAAVETVTLAMTKNAWSVAAYRID